MAWEDVELAIWDLWRTVLGAVAIVPSSEYRSR
jgi:hypothetical protein